ncbi:Cupin domain-containing protein [Arthrobacter crystallopoietes]|uniref:Cupin domain-containing protein n=2 Tax=Crystallibacter crystallopoietes TaxID=37928 RepID=A0A1H1C0Z1_9MICC|nr:Cupin domain-containing protein [Arthrobacter crystallopoietes]
MFAACNGRMSEDGVAPFVRLPSVLVRLLSCLVQRTLYDRLKHSSFRRTFLAAGQEERTITTGIDQDQAGNEEQAAEAPILKIGHVASILGVPTARIRLWEHERLINPLRTDSGQRRYSPRDLERLQTIRDLLDTKAMTLTGVREALSEEVVPPSSMEPSPAPADPVGARAKALRLQQGMSLRDLAKLSGISPSALGAFERGLNKPNTGRISKIAHALGTTVPELLGTAPPESGTVVRAAERPSLPLNDEGVTIELLYRSATALQPQSIVVQPGCGIREAITHTGEDFLVVMTGEINLVLDTIEVHHLGPGDSATFPSTRPHSFHNPGTVPAHLIWVNTPATF